MVLVVGGGGCLVELVMPVNQFEADCTSCVCKQEVCGVVGLES